MRSFVDDGSVLHYDMENLEWGPRLGSSAYWNSVVITIGVFDNCHLHGGDNAGGSRDSLIGKVRIRLSTLETDRVHTYSYPLLVLDPSGVKKMGEICLAVTFTCPSLLNMMNMYSHPLGFKCSSLLTMMNIYSQPLLPKMHYVNPLPISQLETLRLRAIQIVSARLSRDEPPLRKEVVKYMLDVGSNAWSIRRCGTNFGRIFYVFGRLIAFGKWFVRVCNWKNRTETFIALIVFALLFWYYRGRPRHPPHMYTGTRTGTAYDRDWDCLDEEFDTNPTSRPDDIVGRYDYLRSVARTMQTMLDDLATQAERLESLLSWRDPRATTVFVIFCLVAATVYSVTPFRVWAIIAGLYLLSPSRFRSAPLNVFRRLPS
ncbi:C2 domain-containing protein [Heracleum sosnowskyi]|uniref:C2 domain-containing protein n=1 Tax=Heracleum sosnowskyi TaxID=360622 RepID=A0AAD8MC39_9APIA|nr:C2 domain-containing protein [Heracleum sosnowskyi]